uniref:Signal transducer and activator of transcription n=1 Tax=Plectus sambesii TaxID=2011161 RepID=A0A914XF55_9BILA
MQQSKQLYEKCWNLRSNINDDEDYAKKLQAFIRQFSNVLNGMRSNEELHQAQLTLNECQQRLNLMRDAFLKTMGTFLQETAAACKCLSVLSKQLIDERLQAFKSRQQKARIGVPFSEKAEQLNALQQEFETVIKQNYELRKYIEWMTEMLHGGSQPEQDYLVNLDRLLLVLEKMYRHLVFSSFIVSDLPETILKTNHNLKLEVHFLAAGVLDNRSQLDRAKVTLKIVTEETARQLMVQMATDEDYQNRLQNVPAAGSICNSSEKMTESVVHYKAKLSSIHLRKQIIRGNGGTAGEAGDEKVAATALKYALLVQIEPPLNFGTRFGEMDIWTLSNLLTVSVHTSQVCPAYATIIWHLAVSPLDWTQTNVEQQTLNVSDMKEMLKRIFTQFTGSPLELNDSALSYVIAKLTRGSFDETITWEQFAVQQLPDGDFSFWTWFFAAMELIKGKLIDFWNGGYLVGFISKSTASTIIEASGRIGRRECILRFSDSILGAISIGFLSDCADDSNQPEALHMQPFTSKDLDRMPLLHRIASCPQLENISHVYPIGSKEEMLNVLERQMQESTKVAQTSQGKSATKRPYIPTRMRLIADIRPSTLREPSSVGGQSTPSELSPPMFNSPALVSNAENQTPPRVQSSFDLNMRTTAVMSEDAIYEEGMAVDEENDVGPDLFSNVGHQYMDPFLQMEFHELVREIDAHTIRQEEFQLY